MTSPQVSKCDVERALVLVNELLRWACSPVEVRRRVERILNRCDLESERYAFWRLILALIISESSKAAILRPGAAAA